MKPQEPIPHNYSISKLNWIFLWSSLGLLMVTGLMVMYDYVRGWKWFQMEFMRLQRARLTQELRVAEASANKEELARLEKQMQQSTLDVARNREQYLLAQKELEQWEGKHYAADQDYRFAKARLDAARYEVEAAELQHRADAQRKRREFNELNRHVDELNVRLQDVTRRRDAARDRVDVWIKRMKDLEDKRKELTASIDLVNRQLAAASTNANFFILNAPMLDFINPTMRVEQVVLSDLFIDMNYMHVPRVDRCQTCHRAIDRPGWESKKEAARLAAELQEKLDTYQIAAPDRRAETEERIAELKKKQEGRDVYNPFRTHPKLDLYVGSASPHPLLEFGCTGCHRGLDRATEFSRAGHTPASKRMEKRWAKTSWLTMGTFPTPGDLSKRNWGYAANPYLETPMYPRQYYEAGCLKCHGGQVTIAGGEKITRATQMLELYGCHACHKIANWRFEGLQKPGPSLDAIAEKTTPDWVVRWLSDPHKFRSTTRMPAFFYQRNMTGPAVPAEERHQNIRYNDSEIYAITTFLFAKSSRRQWQPPAVAGDAARGKQIAEAIGCMGCHIDTETVTGKDGKVRPARRDDYPLERNFGFNFVGTGTKTHAAWIYNWVKNPKAYDPTTPMPSLRLSDQEAADITAWLMTMQKPQFMAEAMRPPDAKAIRELAKGYLVNTMTVRDADAKLNAMPLREQLIYLGERSVEKYGCYSCHDMKGFEGLKPIGTELTTEGSKNIHLFDFGFVHDYEAWDQKHEHIIHTVPSWIYNKVRSPRVYDDYRSKPYNDKLKMPNFKLSPDEAQLLTTVVVGLTKERVNANRLAASDPHERIAEEGRKLVSQRNCRACHVVDRYGRAIGELIADDSFLPPDLSPQGGRTQSDWLFNFLKDPTVMKIRPWLSVRMPTFHFTDEEANTIVAGFAAQAQAPPFDTQQQSAPPPRNVAIGREVFTMLRCSQCHTTTPVDPENPPPVNVADTTSLAPNLTLSRVRLRHPWIADWIRRPNEMIPGTRMPTNFPRDAATGGFQSPLTLAIDTPQFAGHKATLMPLFGGNEQELKRTMGDAVALTDYLRDYIWAIGIDRMRPARNPESQIMNVPQQPTSPPSLPAIQGAAEQTGAVAPAGR